MNSVMTTAPETLSQVLFIVTNIITTTSIYCYLFIVTIIVTTTRLISIHLH